MTPKSSHPHFDDRGTLSWNTSLESAKAQARAEGKLLFVEMGRQLCSQCRSLVQAVIPRPDVAPLLQRHFVAVAADADDPEPEVLQLAMRLEDAMMLPFVLFADAEGRFLDGYAGVGTAPTLLEHLDRLTRPDSPREA